MMFKIDKRYIAIRFILVIVCYIFGVLITLILTDLISPIDFVVSSLFASVILYILFFFPRKIVIKDGIISFVENNRFERSKVRLADITQTDYVCRFYNTVTIFTKSGRNYILHPKDANNFINYIQVHNQDKSTK